MFGCLFVMSLCEGFRVLGWKKLVVFTFCNACCILEFNDGK